MSISIVRSLDEEEWHRFVDDHPKGNVFHTPEMFQVFRHTDGYQPGLWAAIKDGHVLALLLPVQVTVLNRLFSYFTTRAVVYGSVLYTPSDEGHIALYKVLQAYSLGVEGRPLFTELRNVSDLSDAQSILTDCGFLYEDNVNFLIGLEKSNEALWHGIKAGGRRNVNVARKRGTVIEDATDRKGLVIAHQLLQQVFSRANVPLASPTLFEAALDILAPREMFQVLLARAGERYIGALILLIYKGRIIEWYVGHDRAFSRYFPNELLIWEVLQWGKEHEYQLFDFGGAGKPKDEYGPRRFKAKFGGTLVNQGRNTLVHAPTRLKLSEVGYQLMRRFI